MTDVSFADLAQFGVRDLSLDDAREALVHSMLAEDFLAHMGLDVPENPTDQFYADADQILAHYGVLGMKWGRRRNSDGSVTVDKSKTAGNHPGHSDGASEKPKPRSVKEMSDQELNAVINRMRLEQTYSQMTATKKPVLLEATKEVLGKALKQNAQTYATAYTGVLVDTIIKKAGGSLPKDITAQRNKAAEEAAKASKEEEKSS